MAKSNACQKPATYAVGYGRPPVQTRFQKGTSGNPGGRKKANASERISDILLAEAFRPVQVREGEKVSKMPAIQAVMRSQFQSAAKGNGSAQRLILTSLQHIEARQDARQDELIEAAFVYQQEAREERARKAELGIAPHPKEPHPDDVSVDLHTGAVHFHHPDFSQEARPGHKTDVKKVDDE